jgi:hypothetical protein
MEAHSGRGMSLGVYEVLINPSACAARDGDPQDALAQEQHVARTLQGLLLL